MSKASLELGGTNWAAKDGNLLGYANGSFVDRYVPREFTFSRGSNLAATRVDSNGLIEKGRENLLLQSNNFDTTWTDELLGSIISGQSGYDGTNDAWLLNKGEYQYRRILQSLSTSVSGIWTFSVYAKEGTTSIMNLRDMINANRVQFDLSGSGSVSAEFGNISSKIESVGNGWFRCSATFNNTSSSVGIYVGWNDSTASNIYIQDAQLEQGLVATDYIETGATTATAGLLENEPRIDYTDGTASLLLEPQRSNLLPFSEYFSGLSLSGNPPIITQNYAVSPEGVQNAVRVQDTDATNFKIIQTQFSITAGSTYTISVYVKKATSPISTYGGFYFDFDGGTRKTSNLIFDEYNGTLVNATGNAITSVIHPVIDEGDYWRFSATATDTGSNSLLRPTLRAGASANGTSLSLVTKDYTAYGFQCEEGSYPTSYIPNHSGGIATRTGEGESKASFNAELTTALSQAYTIFVDFEVTNNEDINLNFQDIFAFKFDDLLSKDAIKFETYYIGGVSSVRVFVYKQSSATQATSVAPNVIPMGSRVKLACVLDDSYGVKIFYNGTKIIDYQEVTAYEKTKFLKGSGVDSNKRSKTILHQMLAFPEALSDADCIALTT